MRLLIIEDNPAVIAALKEELKAVFPEMQVSDCGFKNAPKMLRSTRPDIVILDLAEGVTDTDAAGPSWNYVWKEHFCPIIVHTAFEAGNYQAQGHPFWGYERKAAGSPAKIANRIKGFLEHVEGLRVLREEIENRICNSLREVGPLVWKETGDQGQRRDLLRRVTRRRLAASLDCPSCDADNVGALEQFIYPPLEAGLLTGDIIHEAAAGSDSPHAFRIILSPSCDLAEDGNRFPVDEVLVARCVSVTDNEVLRRCVLEPGPKLPEQLGRRLRTDSRADMLVLPELKDAWPAMVADLKRLQLIPRTEIALGRETLNGQKFYRVASMDSPFRERVGWRFTATAGRPGLPDVDESALERDVIRAATVSIAAGVLPAAMAASRASVKP